MEMHIFIGNKQQQSIILWPRKNKYLLVLHHHLEVHL